jgi:magnesium transporter
MERATPASERITAEELLELWPLLDPEEQVEAFRELERGAAESLF